MPLLTCNSVFVTLDMQHLTFQSLQIPFGLSLLAFTLEVSLLTCHAKCVPIDSLHVSHSMSRTIYDCRQVTFDNHKILFKVIKDHGGP